MTIESAIGNDAYGKASVVSPFFETQNEDLNCKEWPLFAIKNAKKLLTGSMMHVQ